MKVEIKVLPLYNRNRVRVYLCKENAKNSRLVKFADAGVGPHRPRALDFCSSLSVEGWDQVITT